MFVNCLFLFITNLQELRGQWLVLLLCPMVLRNATKVIGCCFCLLYLQELGLLWTLVCSHSLNCEGMWLEWFVVFVYFTCKSYTAKERWCRYDQLFTSWQLNWNLSGWCWMDQMERLYHVYVVYTQDSAKVNRFRSNLELGLCQVKPTCRLCSIQTFHLA